MSKYNLYLNTILEMTSRIQDSLKDKNNFMKNAELQDATLMRLQVIGENIKSIPIEVKKKNNQLKWRKFEKLRNLISHKYNSVDYEIVWKFIEENISELKQKILEIKESLDD